MQHITGAGVLIIELYKNTICFVLFKTKYNEYCEPGGLRDDGEKITQTASRECREETANLLKIHPKFLTYHVIANSYMSFVVPITGLRRSDYLHNMKLVHKKCPHQWRETHDMVRVPITNISINTRTCKTYDGNTISLRGRSHHVIKMFMSIADTYLQHIQFYKLNKHITQSKHNKCLNDTITYTIA